MSWDWWFCLVVFLTCWSDMLGPLLGQAYPAAHFGMSVSLSLSLIFSLFSLPFLGLGLDCRLVVFYKLHWLQFCGNPDLLTPLKKGVLALSFIWVWWISISHVHISGLQLSLKVKFDQKHMFNSHLKMCEVKWHLQINEMQEIFSATCFEVLCNATVQMFWGKIYMFWKKYILITRGMWSEMQ